MPNLSFFVPGIPRPGGSKKAFPRIGKDGKLHVNVAPDCKKTKAWMETVATYARVEYRGKPISTYANKTFKGRLLAIPVKVHFYFYMPRPKAHYRTGKFSHLLRADAPWEHTQTPDKTKLRRAAEDALKGILYADDSQITQGFTTKSWTHITEGMPGVQITMEWGVEE